MTEKRRRQQREAKQRELARPGRREQVNANWVAAEKKRIEKPEYVERKLAQSRSRYKLKSQDPAYKKRQSLKHRCKTRGITLEQYDAMQDAQGGLCAICGQPERRKHKGVTCELSIDHCHNTGEVRALLCDWCNTGIGRFGDNIALIEKAIKYLENHKQ